MFNRLIYHFEELRRRRWFVAAVVVGGVVFVAGVLSIVDSAKGLLPRTVKTALSQAFAGKTITRAAKPVKTGEVTTIDKATFDVLIPDPDPAWEYDTKSQAFDKSHGVVKYQVKTIPGNVSVTISQQVFPDTLKPRTGPAFNKLINDTKVQRSQEVGDGVLYYLPALENGAPSSNGADTVIYATDATLMFAQAGTIMRDTEWVKLMGAMHPSAPGTAG